MGLGFSKIYELDRERLEKVIVEAPVSKPKEELKKKHKK